MDLEQVGTIVALVVSVGGFVGNYLISRGKNRTDDRKVDIEGLTALCDRLEKRLEETEEELATLKAELRVLREENTELRMQIRKLEDERAALRQQIAELQAQMDNGR